MAEELKTRLTDDQIADLEANLPLADIIGAHSDHRLKEVPDEVILTYNLSNILRLELIDIRLTPAATQVLEKGEYVVCAYNDAYTIGEWGTGDVHMEIYVAAAWIDYPRDLAASDDFKHFYSDGENVRVANADGANTHRLIGFRKY